MAVFGVKGEVVKFGGKYDSLLQSLAAFGWEGSVASVNYDSTVTNFFIVKVKISCLLLVQVILFSTQ